MRLSFTAPLPTAHCPPPPATTPACCCCCRNTGLTFSNEMISRDEGLHTDFACHLYALLRHRWGCVDALFREGRGSARLSVQLPFPTVSSLAFRRAYMWSSLLHAAHAL